MSSMICIMCLGYVWHNIMSKSQNEIQYLIRSLFVFFFFLQSMVDLNIHVVKGNDLCPCVSIYKTMFVYDVENE